MPRRTARKRGQSPHPGVVIFKKAHRSGSHTHVARWTDPRTGSYSYTSLTALGLSNDEGRRNWAVKMSKDLVRERERRSIGERPAPEIPESMEAAIQDYLGRRPRLRPKTLGSYADDLATFAEYAGRADIARLDQLRPLDLVAFYDYVIAKRKLVPQKGGTLGQCKLTQHILAPASVNRILRGVKTFLSDARAHGMTPHLDGDAIRDGLKKVSEPRPKPGFLRPAQIRQVLEAALRHDAETYTMTRLEKEGLRLAGSTMRYDPIAPFVLIALLTGARLSELLTLPTGCVHLSEREIVITAGASKTHRERSIDLNVCPSLMPLLTAMRTMSGKAFYVFGDAEPLPLTVVKAAKKRLCGRFGAPRFSWQNLRQTAATYLVNAPGIFGTASVYREAVQLGHSVAVAERNYVGLMRNIPVAAKTLESAMGIEDLAGQIVDGFVARAT